MTPIARFARRLSATVFIFLCAVAPVAAQEPKPLVWAADQEGGLPYIGLDGDGKLIGFEVELKDALARELKRPIDFKQYEFKNIVLGLLKGDFDFAMNGLEITADRKHQVIFSKPYYAYRQQLVVRKDDNRIQNFEDCKKLPDIVVGTLDGCAAQRLLAKANIETTLYDDQLEAYKDLGLKRTDAVLMDLPIALYCGKNDKLRFAGDPFAKGYYAIAVRPNDPELAVDLDAALDRLRHDGTLKKIYTKWGLWDEAQEKLDKELEADTWTDGLANETSIHYSPAGYLPLLLKAALLTIVLTIISFALAAAIGMPLALMRLYGPWWLRSLATAYIEFFRGVPVMFLLFMIYFGMPGIADYYGLPFSLGLPAFMAGILGLGLNYAAYEAEIYRAAVQAIPAGQWEAAASLGMPAPLTFRRIILPQAMRSILPPATGDLVALFKDTSIVSTIGLIELTKEFLILSRNSHQFVEIGLVTAAFYLLMSVPLGQLSHYLEKRWSRHTA